MPTRWTLETFAAAVADMRTKQAAYFLERKKGRPKDLAGLLQAARAVEAVVDQALAEIDDYRPMFDPELRGP